MTAVRCVMIGCVALAACHDDDWLSYRWDDRRVLCSQAIDDSEWDADLVEESFAYAHDHDAVALLHAHKPGKTVSARAIERILDMADLHHLAFVGFDELATGPARAGFALAFDDDAIDAWFAQRAVLGAHFARVTFFVTRYDRFTDEQKAELRQLADDGHDIEAHSVHHVVSTTYVEEHGLEAYIADEVVPSIEALVRDGYSPTSFAFPGGAATPEIWDRVLAVEGVQRVRVSPGDCPY